MNLLLLEPAESDAATAVISGRRANHMRTVQRAVPGTTLRAGVIGGGFGEVKVLADDGAAYTVTYTAVAARPPAPLPLQLVIALPRPKMVNRLLQAVTAMGIKQITFINSWRVEKSYWQSPQLSADNIRLQLLLGLEQGVDTQLPTVTFEPLFKPFVEDRLAAHSGDGLRLLAHPSGGEPCPVAAAKPATLVVGPEGGFIDYEVALLTAQGFSAVTMGPRILRVETAVVALASRLYPAG